MASPGPEDRSHILSVNIQDGKAFGPDLQAVVCAATFAGETKLTPYSVGRDTHVWNTTLQWRVTLDQFRRLTSLGQKDCKVVLTNKDGTKLGWFLVDIRAAKLQAQYKKDEGVWMGLTGAKKGDSPQVYVQALFYEDRPGALSSPEPKQSPSKARGVRRQQAANRSSTAALPGVSEAAGDAATASGPAAGAGDPGRSSEAADGVDAAGLPRGGPTSAGTAAAAPTAGLPNFGSPARGLGPAAADEGPFRHFALMVDVRSFQSSKRLPLSTASVYVQAIMPPELIELVVGSGFRLPSRLAPLTTHPTVDIPRGTEGALPNGYGTLEFTAGVVQLARVLAREPRVSVEAWHKERFRTDMLLGAGSVPLTPLLQGAWVDGYAPLFALVASAVGADVREERVQVGSLRVVLSLEDKGPAAPPGSQPLATAAASAAPLAPPSAFNDPTAAATALIAQPSFSDPSHNAAATDAAGATGPAAAAAASDDSAMGLRIREMYPAPPNAGPQQPAATNPAGGSSAVGLAGPQGSVPLPPPQRQQQPALPPSYGMAPPPTLSLPPPPALALGPGALRGSLPAAAGAAGAGRQSAPPEFEAAWELEVWKKAEEARWRSELREREAQRMMVLESEWRRRERAREAELAGLKAEYLALEDKAQQVLAAAEGRERRIVAAEEALLRRRKELEREHAARMVEAEAAVRRLQVECEHQLDIEKDRNAELVRRVAMLEERLAASEARCLAVENEFADFRAASRSTPEAELARQLAEARETAKAAEARAAKAAKAKQGYKEQVRKLAEQLAALQRRRPREEEQPAAAAMFGQPLGGGPGLGLSAAPAPGAIRAAAQEQARFAASQQQELAAMRAQLQAIKAAAMAQLSPSSSPRGRGSDGGGSRAAGNNGAAAAGAVLMGGAADVDADSRGVNDQHRHAVGRSDWRASEGRVPAVAIAATSAQQHSSASHSGASRGASVVATSHPSAAPDRRPTAAPPASSTSQLPPAAATVELHPPAHAAGPGAAPVAPGGSASSGPSPAGSIATSTSSTTSHRPLQQQQPTATPQSQQAAAAAAAASHPPSWQQQQQLQHQHQEYQRPPHVYETGMESGGYEGAAPAYPPSSHPAGRARWDVAGGEVREREEMQPWLESPQQVDTGAHPHPARGSTGGSAGSTGALLLTAGSEQRQSLADHLANASSAAAVWYQQQQHPQQQHHRGGQQPHPQHQQQRQQLPYHSPQSTQRDENEGTWRAYQDQHEQGTTARPEEEEGDEGFDEGDETFPGQQRRSLESPEAAQLGARWAQHPPREASAPDLQYSQYNQQQYQQQQLHDHRRRTWEQQPHPQHPHPHPPPHVLGAAGQEDDGGSEHTLGRAPHHPGNAPAPHVHGPDPAYYPHVGGPGDDNDGDGGGGDMGDYLAEIQRLTRRKMELLRRGHSPDEELVVLLDERIQALLAESAGLAPPATR
ncbi:hypothetical protein Agub_g6376 [Astrephomene gubernaculifera]|uniref:C2 domain-containing protein n=1 Tax=Astrephomene gubernaculifera TaxID=47775 RepID=A0AAD3DNR2_9CHLO|nr:hypothetical protein Agub_g6376 [Astrephomene gubernaculifera]